MNMSEANQNDMAGAQSCRSISFAMHCTSRHGLEQRFPTFLVKLSIATPVFIIKVTSPK